MQTFLPATALATCLVWTVGQFGVSMPPEVGASFAGLLIWGVDRLVGRTARDTPGRIPPA